jgi:hypothetical protein
MTDTTGQGRGTVAARLRRARERRFVGRAGELELFRAALDTPEPPFTVLWVHGPGGVGKSALLRAFADSAADAGATATLLDLRDVEPSPSGFTTALGEPGRVLLLDTWESAAPLDGWLRERFLPALPADSVVVVAGRVPPSRAGGPMRAGATCSGWCRCATCGQTTAAPTCTRPGSPSATTTAPSRSRTATRSRSPWSRT